MTIQFTQPPLLSLVKCHTEAGALHVPYMRTGVEAVYFYTFDLHFYTLEGVKK